MAQTVNTSKQAVISGTGESRFSRRSDAPLARLQLDAINAALTDAGLEPGDIDGVFTDGSVMPVSFPIDVAQTNAGLHGVRRVGQFATGGTGTALAVMEAAKAIRQGDLHAALIYFGVDWGSSQPPYSFHDRYRAKVLYEQPYGYYGQALYFATIARRYAHEYGYTMDQLARGLGQIAVDHRANALLNSNAQQSRSLDLDTYLAEGMLADPLRRYDCCLQSDGAVALILTSEEFNSHKDRPAVVVTGAGYAADSITDESFFSQNPLFTSLPSAHRSAALALSNAGVTVEQLDFVQAYDCFTPSPLMQLEALGVCAPGAGIEYVTAGTAIGSDLPLNTHGGSLAQCYLLGINHISEAVRQLRGEAGAGQVKNASKGAVMMAPGRDHVTLILERS
ncbi:MAG: thiolase family protein [Halieaceae bacterium]|nr:thiolase family protein [Halieaceae bacterium]